MFIYYQSGHLERQEVLYPDQRQRICYISMHAIKSSIYLNINEMLFKIINICFIFFFVLKHFIDHEQSIK